MHDTQTSAGAEPGPAGPAAASAPMTPAAAPMIGEKAGWRVLAALLAGLLAGALLAGADDGVRDPVVRGASMVGAMWLDALQMTVVPLVVALLVTGIVGGMRAARAGGVAARSVGWFLAILWASALFAAIAMPALLGLAPLPEASAEALRTGLAAVDRAATAAAVPTLADFLGSIVPSNVISAAAEGNILQLIIFTLFFGFGVTRLDEARRETVLRLFDAIGAAMLVVIGWILWIAPLGVFALGLAVAAGAGGAVFGAVLHYVVLVSLLGIAVMLAGYALAIGFGRVAPLAFAKAMIGPQAVAISTQSSLASLPAMLAACRRLGVRPGHADVTLPLAVALFRSTGPAMNLGVAIYVAHWMGIELTPTAILAGVAVAATTTLGAVSLPGQISFVTSIAPIALAMGLPIEPLAILIAVETVPDIFRTLGNVVNDVAVTTVVDRKSIAAEARAAAAD